MEVEISLANKVITRYVVSLQREVVSKEKRKVLIKKDDIVDEGFTETGGLNERLVKVSL